MNLKEAGILMHISSLPSPYGIGTFGKAAYDFVDFLHDAKIKIWQILPLNVTSYGDSPYQSPSNYGYNYYFIDLDTLKSKGLLNEEDYKNVDFGDDESRVNYAKLFDNRITILKKAFHNFKKDELYEVFLTSNQNARDFAFFMTLKELNNYRPWYEWSDEIRNYTKELEEKIIEENSDLFEFYMWTQFEFLREYSDLKAYAKTKGIKIMGDLPIYLAYDSVECYKYPEMFQFDENKTPTKVAGCPPDCFSVDGQLWGNPLYNWEYHKNSDYKWWNERINSALKMYDLVRIDHFRGFSGYYSIPYGDKTARNGKWVKGPGFDLFKDKLNLPIVAEDLGSLDDDFMKFFEACGYPGMKIVTQAFDDDSIDNIWRPSNYTYNYFSYSGTHDSETTRQYVDRVMKDKISAARLKKVIKEECKYFGIECKSSADNAYLTTKICELNMASKSRAAITPMQDLLNIGQEGRMNFPSTLSTLNWSWRIKKVDFEAKKDAISALLCYWVKIYKR